MPPKPLLVVAISPNTVWGEVGSSRALEHGPSNKTLDLTGIFAVSGKPLLGPGTALPCPSSRHMHIALMKVEDALAPTEQMQLSIWAWAQVSSLSNWITSFFCTENRPWQVLTLLGLLEPSHSYTWALGLYCPFFLFYLSPKLTSAKTSSAFYLHIFSFWLQFSRQQRRLLGASKQGVMLMDHSPTLSEQQRACVHAQWTVTLHPVQRCG